MTNIAYLSGDTIIYWNEIIMVIGLLSGIVLAFAIRPFTQVKRLIVLLWVILTIIFSFFFSRMLYYYCNTEQFVSFKDALGGIFDPRYSVTGVVIGALLAALIAGMIGKNKCVKKLLDAGFPGVVLSISIIRLSYFFTDTYHSNLEIETTIWQRFPFAVITTDAAGNASYTFAPFMISAIVLFLTAFVAALFIRKKIRRAGELFLIVFTFFAFSEMVLEGTRNDSLKLHFSLLKSLNNYMSFICFSMFVLAIFLIIFFIVNCRRSVKTAGMARNILPILMFTLGFILFGICEYLVQRYTNSAALYHWLQTLFAAVAAVGMIIVVHRPAK